jgi:hypothetical protein
MTAAESSPPQRYSLRSLNARAKQGMHSRVSASRPARCSEESSPDFPTAMNARMSGSLRSEAPHSSHSERKHSQEMREEEQQTENSTVQAFVEDMANIDYEEPQSIEEQPKDVCSIYESATPVCDGSVFVFSDQMTERRNRIAEKRKMARQLIVPPHVAAKLFRSSWLAAISALVAYSQGTHGQITTAYLYTASERPDLSISP